MVLPGFKYVEQVALPGQYSFLTTGVPYTGKMIETYTGKYYAGSKVDAEKELTKLNSSNKSSKALFTGKHEPSESEYVSGYFMRYFVQDTRTGKVTELRPEKYKGLQENRPNYYHLSSRNWILKGNLQDRKIGNQTIPGVFSKNWETMLELENELPGILSSGVITSPLEYTQESAE